MYRSPKLQLIEMEYEDVLCASGETDWDDSNANKDGWD